MDEIYINKEDFYFNNRKSHTLNDLYTKEFYEYSNSKAYSFKNDSFVVNELFISVIQPYLALEYIISKENIRKIKYKKINNVLNTKILDIAIRINLEYKNNQILYKLKVIIIAHLQIIASTIYLFILMLKIPFKRNNTIHNDFSIIRTIASEKKIKNIGIPYEIENPRLKSSIYRIFPIRKRLYWVFKSWIKSYDEISCYRDLIHKYIGPNSATDIYILYGKRIVHTFLYYYMLDNLFSNKRISTFYTGNNLDRFSVIEELLATKYNIKTVCIPHGLEYGFKFPKGFSGQTHYTTTEYASHFLNNLYKTNKFLYDSEVARKMFRIEGKYNYNGCKIVFFTESREIAVNIEIIERLAPLLREKSINLYLKLHPDDSPTNYEKFGLKIITDLDIAIVGNICISRKSTILLEATYNDSIAAAILINEKDKSIFSTFPSLNSENINVFYTIEDLFTWSFNQYNSLKGNLFNN